jgi:hypothetical protein
MKERQAPQIGRDAVKIESPDAPAHLRRGDDSRGAKQGD